ncbi:hypothetical protein LQ757_13385 [Agromyces sp. SYSU K20354]|uniref:hypothetical protein n=1 Tax=Agromyces cavernae TaxID=2898659 RepID=UPI001E3B66D1|nr:hypothetical protein [Agromyces cavernae]MCD2443271.1 hypothetical protein [Agromyces cavernae]
MNRPRRTQVERAHVLAWSTALLLQVPLIALAAWASWPAEFADDGSTPTGWGWILEGSALTPPLSVLGAMLVMTLGAALLNGRWGMVVTVAGVVVALAALVGGLGEAFASGPIVTPRGVLVASGVLWALLSGWIVVTSVRRCSSDRHGRTVTFRGRPSRV